MNALPARTALRMNLEEFLAFTETRPDEERWELIDGAPRLMPTASVEHELICGNLAFALEPQVRPRGCRVLRNLLTIRADRDDFGGIPDLIVRCGPFVRGGRTIAQAIVAIEVLSPSTMSYDRGEKLRHYLAMDPLRHLALVYQTEMRVELWTRVPGAGWPEAPEVLQEPAGALALAAIGSSVAVAEIYEGVDLTPA